MKKSRGISLGAGLIVGGGLYNLAERVFTGCVSDYFSFFNISFFNVADIAIFVGVLTIAVRLCIKPLMLKD